MTAGVETHRDSLRDFELRLLRCSLPATSSSVGPSDTDELPHSVHSFVKDVITATEAGDYVRALSSDAARTIFQFADSSFLEDGPERFYSELVLQHAEMFLFNGLEDERERSCKVFLLMSVGVAAFLAFTQCNITGPVERLPPLPVATIECDNGNAGVSEWEGWARNQIMASGSDLLGKLCNIQYLVFAKTLLTRIKDLLSEGRISSMDGTRSISWWLARILLVQQRIVDERSSSLFDLLHVYTSESLSNFGTWEKVTSYWGPHLEEEEASTIVSMLYLEAGLMEHYYGRVNPSRQHFESAEAASGLQLSVTGSLGFRTVHQVEPKAQRLLVSNPRLSQELNANGSGTVGDKLDRSYLKSSEVSDILMTPEFVEEVSSRNSVRGTGDNVANRCTGDDTADKGTGDIAPLKDIQLTVILAQCLLIERSTPHDEMQRWDMAPYIEAVDSQPSQPSFIIQYFCDILRVRWESTRSRTKERALLMMDKLVQSLRESFPSVAQRIYFSFGVCIPTMPALRKEYAELLVSCGMVGDAIKIFEDLELWDSLIYCYRLLEKKPAAVEIIKKRLSEFPNDPRLWCSLGDVTNDDACFKKALEVSNNSSARAKRSLARSAYNKGDYEKSKILWESAIAQNSLYPDGWFALGAAALKARDIEKALQAFTSAVQLDPDNGEAWNNIACLHMIKKKNELAFIAFKEALKFKRNSWQLWENFSHVAVDVGNFPQALEAVQKVLDMTKSKKTDPQLLERMMVEIEERIQSSDPQLEVSNKTRETDHLVELLGKILQQIVKNGGEAEIWGLYARWHKLKGDLMMCSEALLKQVRSYQGSDLWKDSERFKKFAHASVELCKVYMEISSSTGSRRELFAAEMHLKNTIKQAWSFAETEEFRDLQTCLDKVQLKL